MIDCIHTRDADKDGFLTYSEFEDLLMQDLRVGLNHPKLYESIVIDQMLDPGRKRSKISASSIKFYLGADSQANLDMVPSHEKKFVKPARAGDEESKAPDTRSA